MEERPDQHQQPSGFERPRNLFGPLAQRYFRRMWAVTSISSLGDWLGLFALTIYVKELSDRPDFAIGGVLLFRVIPGMFFGPFAGVLADRFDRRRLMVSADIMRTVLIASIPWIRQLWVLYLVSAAMEVLQLLWAPAKDATVPNLVDRDQLMRANQLSLISTYATFPVAGALVALLAIPAAYLSRFEFFAVLGDQPIALAFFIDAATFAFSAAIVATFPARLMKAKRVNASVENWNPFRDLLEGLRFLKTEKIVRTMVFGAWVAFTGGSAIVSLGPVLTDHLVTGTTAQSQAAWGTLIVAVGSGLVGGMVGAGFLATYMRRERIFPVGLMVSGLGSAAIASMSSFKPAIPLAIVVGAGAGVAWVSIFTLLQERTEDHLRGRTFATLYTGIHLSLLIGLAGWPLLAGTIDPRARELGEYFFGGRFVLWGGGLFLFLSGVMAMRGVRGAIQPRQARKKGLSLSAAMSGAQRTGLLVTFEGGEGAGKTTQMALLHGWLAERGREVVVTREPGGTVVSDLVRTILLENSTGSMDAKTEALLYAASRAQLVSEVIKPALERGAVVLCDRYVDSSLAYQGIARGLGQPDVLAINTWATDETMADVVVLLHVEPEVGLARKGDAPDRMESESIDFHKQVNEAFLHLAREYPSRYAVVDSSGPRDMVQQQIRTAIRPFLDAPVSE